MNTTKQFAEEFLTKNKEYEYYEISYVLEKSLSNCIVVAIDKYEIDIGIQFNPYQENSIEVLHEWSYSVEDFLNQLENGYRIIYMSMKAFKSLAMYTQEHKSKIKNKKGLSLFKRYSQTGKK